MLAPSFIAGWVGWVTLSTASLVSFARIFIVIYAGIWVGFYLYFRRLAKQLNDSLN